MRTLLSRGTVALTLLVLPIPCFGWGEDGHRIVATLAAAWLTPQAKTAVDELLEGKSLADVSTWADEIKSDSAYRWASSLHYANVAPEADSFDLARDCPANGCVVSAIFKYTQVLQDGQAGTADKTEALEFLVHFVGDVHQPLHVARAHDKGGNDIKVEFFNNRTNLHGVWDSELIRRTKRPWSAYATELRQAISSGPFMDWYGVSDPAVWATESYQFALSHAYAIPKDGQLGQEYFDRCIPVVDQRLSMAGVRLAGLLNGIFADGGGAIRAPETQPASQPATGPAFVGGRKSDAYYSSGCPDVKMIQPENLVEYPSAPPGKRLHTGYWP